MTLVVHISHGRKQDFGIGAEPEVLFLKIYPCSKPGNDSMPSNAAHVEPRREMVSNVVPVEHGALDLCRPVHEGWRER